MVVGASGAVVLASGSAAQAEVPKGRSGRARIARVVRQSGASADVEVLSATGTVLAVQTAPVVGFPAGWRLRRGDRVVLTGAAAGANPSMIMPLVEPIQGHLEGGGQSSARIAGRAIIVRDGEAVGKDAVEGDSVAFCIRNDVDGSLSAVSVQPVSAFAVAPQ